jgi:hypothetical protein
MVAVRALAVPKQRDGSLFSKCPTGFEERVAGRFSERETVTIFVARTAGLGGQQL